VGIALGAVLATTPAHAQNFGGDAAINAWRPAMDSRGYITVNASQTLGHKELSFGLVTNWGRNMLTLEDGNREYVVNNIITPTLIGAIGIKAGLDFEIGLSIPFGIMNGDRNPNDDGGTPSDPNDDANFKFEGQGVGNVGLHVKARFLNTSKGRRIGLAVIGSVILPTATESDKWLGEGKVTPQVLGVIDKEFGEKSQLRVAAQGGIRIRSKQTFTDMTTGLTPAPMTTGQTVEIGPSIPFGAGIAWALVPQKFDLVGEVLGELPLGGENYFPLEAIGGIKLYLARNSFLTLGGGVGFIPDKGGNPDIRGFIGIVFEPNIGDRDGDGLKDDVDKCPDDPEDFDDFEDEDGCPEPDNDLDGIPDVNDKCPNEPEDKDGIDDEDGCPEKNELDRDGDGILDKDDDCPDRPEDKDKFEDTDGCPDPDNDKDGILDVDDVCPDDPEDKDGFKDSDGCPDNDNDEDRIPDKSDKCPGKDGEDLNTTKETYNGVDDDDGCPDRGRVVVTDTKIEILDKVYFVFNKAIIKQKSFPILNAVAATLKGNPDILRIEIQGHTDSRGGDAYNKRLSASRAAAVLKYLVDKGIEKKRLESHGYGESKPAIPCDPRNCPRRKGRKWAENAWAKNRRVEFLILKRAP
jgi:outer membrane protein OmpA-like peptidoglycan-associated protein